MRGTVQLEKLHCSYRMTCCEPVGSRAYDLDIRWREQYYLRFDDVKIATNLSIDQGSKPSLTEVLTSS